MLQLLSVCLNVLGPNY